MYFFLQNITDMVLVYQLNLEEVKTLKNLKSSIIGCFSTNFYYSSLTDI